MEITQKQLDEIAEEFLKAEMPAEHCHFCKQPVYRIPFQEVPKVDDKIMCLDCMLYYEEYKKLIVQ
jgi:hypothetical protein